MMHDSKTVLAQILDDQCRKIEDLEGTVRVLFECLARTQRKLDEARRETDRRLAEASRA